MSKPATVTLLVPTLDEIDGMRVIMPQIRPDWCDQVLVVDGGSTDGTAEWAREQGYEVVTQRERGIRYAYIEAMEHVRGDIVITFSPDGNSVPDRIPPLLEEMRKGRDMVIVSRYLDDAKSDDDDTLTAFGNWIFNQMTNRVHGARYTDCMVMFRAWRRSLFEELDLHRDESYELYERLFFTRMGVEPLLSVRCAKRGLDVGEIPGDEPARIGGERKLQIFRWGAAYTLQIFREKFRWK